MDNTKTETLDLGNNETVSRGVFAQADGTYLAALRAPLASALERAAADVLTLCEGRAYLYDSDLRVRLDALRAALTGTL